MKLSRFTKMARDAIDRRGGVDGVKRDVERAREAARGPGSVTDKARAAAEALRKPDGGGSAESSASRRPSDGPAGTA